MWSSDAHKHTAVTSLEPQLECMLEQNMHNTIFLFIYLFVVIVAVVICTCLYNTLFVLYGRRCFAHCVCRLHSACRWIAIQRITNGGNAIMTGRRAFRLGNDGPCVCVCVWLCLMRFFNQPDYLSACAGAWQKQLSHAAGGASGGVCVWRQRRGAYPLLKHWMLSVCVCVWVPSCAEDRSDCC